MIAAKKRRLETRPRYEIMSSRKGRITHLFPWRSLASLWKEGSSDQEASFEIVFPLPASSRVPVWSGVGSGP